MLKHYEKWDKIAVTYKVKKTAVVNIVDKTLKTILEPLQKELIKPMFKDEQVKKEIILKDFPEVALVTDVTFQTRTRPKMLFREAQYYFQANTNVMDSRQK